MKTDLLIIDPQVDFCKPEGSLYVEGADEDMQRVADMIERLSDKVDKIDNIFISIDTHEYVDIAHPVFWESMLNNEPIPFTIITHEDVVAGKWTPTKYQYYNHCLMYTKQLEENNRYPLCIWPPHCLEGTIGHNIHPSIEKAITVWENSWENNLIELITKGDNPLTEHYSVIKAEIPLLNDYSTQINKYLIDVFKGSDVLAIMGEAGSHCVANTLIDIADIDKDIIKKVVWIEDGISPVTGFEDLQNQVIQDMTALGMQISNTKDFLS